MSFLNTHYYSAIGFDSTKLKRASSIAQKSLDQIEKTTPFDLIIGTGTSSLSFMMAMHMWSQKTQKSFDLVYLRKEGDDSHGDMFEVLGGTSHCDPHEGLRYLILDDFISSGRTVRKVHQRTQKHAEEKKVSMECVGIFLYNPSWASYKNSKLRDDSFELSKELPCVPEWSML